MRSALFAGGGLPLSSPSPRNRPDSHPNMKHRPRRLKQKGPSQPEPEWARAKSSGPAPAMSAAELEELVRGVWLGIRDTAAWKDLVRRCGRTEAKRILRLAIYGGHGIRGDKNN